MSPMNTSRPNISGQLIVGRTLRGSVGSWTGTAPVAYAYQWKRCKPTCTNIAGATHRTYRLTGADWGAQIRLFVTAANAVGNARAPSPQIGPVASVRQIHALIRKSIAPHGLSPRLDPIVHLGFVVKFKAPLAGKLRVVWKLGKTVVAKGTLTLGRGSHGQMRLRFTARGLHLIQQTSQLRLYGGGTFTP